ncbi:MAG: peptidylprolyl isomerase [Bacteroidetes bacterium]|nr:peptidylprolyl isomerase [Fibrella sp.]
MTHFIATCSLILAFTATQAQTVRQTNNLTQYSDQQAKQTIDSIYSRLVRGENFEKLAVKLSQDPGSFSNGGKLDWQRPNIYVPAFRDTLNTLPIHQFSRPFKTSFGYHIVQIIRKRKDEVLSRHILLRIKD